MAIIKLRVSLYGRENGEKRTIAPGVYNTEDADFPEILRGETRPQVVEIPDGFAWEVDESAEASDVDLTADAEDGSENEKPVRRKKK